MSEMQFTRINEFSDEQLITELMSRFDNFVVSGLRIDTKGNDLLFDYKGEEYTTIQMCADLIFSIKSDGE